MRLAKDKHVSSEAGKETMSLQHVLRGREKILWKKPGGALALYCFEVNVVKRYEGTMYGPILAPYCKELEEPRYKLLWPHFNSRALSLPSKEKPLVVEECSSKICSISKLQSFCY